MSGQQTTDYEELPYTNNSCPSSHPFALSTVGWLHGLTPPIAKQCRVLELGCGRGGNILPMAEGMPESEFVGLDLSHRQIADAVTWKNTAGLNNAEFRTMDLCEVGPDLGQFDFIIAHGVYSWVPPHVQEHLLRICSQNLTPDGLAYVSYNTYPGWHYRGVIRDLLNHFVARDAGARDQVDQARRLMEAVIKALPDPNGIRTKLVIEECRTLLAQADGYIYHDHLEADNRPCYFHQFIDHARQHDLQFVAEALVSPLREGIPGPARQAATEIIGDDHLQNEQLTDYLIHRTFRRTILCHHTRQPTNQVVPERLLDCSFRSSCQPAENTDSSELNAPRTFVTRQGDSFTTNHPLVCSVLIALYEASPSAMPFAELVEEVARRRAPSTAASDAVSEVEVAHICFETYRRGAVEIHRERYEFCSVVSDRPHASWIARLQADGDSRVTNREHRSIDLNAVDRFLLTQMDGVNTIEELLARTHAHVSTGKLEIQGYQTLAASEQLDRLRHLIVARCQYLASNGFLIA